MRRLACLWSVIVGCGGGTTSPKLHVELSGDGTGTVNGCSTSCDLPADTANLYARTTDRFGGWAGCTPTSVSNGSGISQGCTVAVSDADVTVTATFTKDMHEVTALFPDVPTTAGAFASNGDLVVAGVDGSNQPTLSRITQQGTTVWSTSLSVGKPSSVRVGTYIFALGITGLAEVTLDGTIMWTVAIDVADGLSRDTLAITPDGNAAIVATGGNIEVRSQLDGSVVWSQPGAGGAVAVDTQGDVDTLRSGSVMRFDRAGNPLSSWSLPTTSGPGSMVIDTQDNLYVYIAAEDGTGEVTRFTPTGTAQSFSAPSLVVTAVTAPFFVAIRNGANDHVVTAIPNFPNITLTQPFGALVASFAPDGTLDWTLEKAGYGQEVPIATFALFDGVIMSDIACTPTGLCAMIGQHEYADGDGGPANEKTPWIELVQQ